MTRDYSDLFARASATPNSATRPRSELEILGWQAFYAQQISIDEMAETPPVRVIEVHRNRLHVLGDGIDATIPHGFEATVGDWLLLEPVSERVARLLDRKSLIKRRAPGHDRAVQLIAANIETAFIVTSCNADFNVARLERYVALALEAQITPVILLTKTDLVADHADFVDQARAISDEVAVIALDARGTEPATKLAPWCKPGQTVAFLGSSGVGKSTLTNALIGADTLGGAPIETHAIREDDAKGRHTTTSRQLHFSAASCAVLDTPGMRELQLTDVSAGIDEVFSDLSDLATSCKFNDCAHDTEPGCAIRAALETGEIDAARVLRWRKLLAEDAFNTATLSQRKSKDKALGKIIRQIQKDKPR